MVLFRGFAKSDLFSKIYGRLHAKSHEVSCSKTKFLYFFEFVLLLYTSLLFEKFTD